MKSTKEFKGKVDHSDEETLRRAAKLPPLKKSGKEKHVIFGGVEDDEEDGELLSYKKRESILDYFDEGEEDE